MVRNINYISLTKFQTDFLSTNWCSKLLFFKVLKQNCLIFIQGGRIIAGHVPEDPFLKKLTINLVGERSDEIKEVDFQGQ